MPRSRLKKNFSIEDLKAKLLSKIAIDQLTGCWLWTDYIRPNGYAYMRIGRKAQPAIHRVSYKLFKGEIPENYHVHHLCGVKHCCNPEHLELQLPSQHQSLHRSHITHCPKGHPYDEENTYKAPGTNARQCKKCQRERTKLWEQSVKGKAYKEAYTRNRR